ncbi:hypothetical protein ACUXZJ_07100 [Flavobacterium sp. TN-1]
MNYQNFNQSGGFPIKTQTLNDMQTSWSILNNLGEIAGNYAILSGCEETNGIINKGVIYLNGEVLEFVGGVKSPTIIIKETAYKREFKDGTNKEVLFVRKAMFGIGSTVYNWSDFKRAKTTVKLTEEKAEKTELEKLIERVRQLEARPVSNVPKDMIALWDRPANEIPAGWIEYVPLKGRMPIGHDDAYDSNTNGDLKNYNLNQLGYAGGVREHKLILDEIPAHNHSPGGDSSFLAHGYDGVGTGGGLGFSGIASQGKDRPHNNMSPYRVVKFIQYKGI